MKHMIQKQSSTFRRSLAAVALASFAAIGSAAAQDANEGVTQVVTAINSLKPDLGTVVLAAIGIALISIGAVAAISLAKRLMGK